MPDMFSYLWIGLGAILIALDLWAIISVFRSNHGVSSKSLWSLGIVLFPVLGLVVWGIAGPRGVAEPPSSPEHSKG